MTEILVDSLDSAGAADENKAYAGGNKIAGQAFTGIAGNLASCKFWLRKTGSPTGSCYAVLHAHTGTYGTTGEPTGAALATSDAVDVSTLTTSYAWYTFTFSGDQQYTMSATYYTIHFIYSGGDASNAVWYPMVTPSVHDGNYFSGSAVTSDMTPVAAKDFPFYVYKVAASTGNNFSIFL